MVAKFLDALFEDASGVVHEQRRHRELALARSLEDVATLDLAPLQVTRLAGHAEIVFGAIVERLELRVAQRPVDYRTVLRDRRRAIALDGLRPHTEVALVESPRDCAIVNGAAADLVAIVQRRHRHRARVSIGPPGDGLTLWVWAQVLAQSRGD